ncbi:MAG: 8-amino-7-oxononanoate synthase [Deltaproteobacteria bacterium RBG_13_52_11]|nr:MAG: 8-amino-7-oxononanoate synthase [Deltaproteobacteria bacterium RBG_13_52_11]
MTFLATALEAIKERDLYRQLRPIQGAQSPRVQMEGKEVILLSSNNYLGLAEHPALREAGIRTLERYGCGAGASRSISGTMELHRALEERIARFKGCEAALLFSTGYMANMGLLTTLAEDGDVIVSDEFNHASIVDGCRLSRAEVWVYRHRDMDHLETLLRRSAHRRRLIVTDGVFSMEGAIAPLPEIRRLADQYGALVMVDDAHATGVLGKGGRGTGEHFGMTGRIEIQMGTLGKALGGFGAYVVGTQDLIDYLINCCRTFMYTTALPPAIAAMALAALDIVEKEPQRRQSLWENTGYFRTGLQKMDFDTGMSETPICPVLIKDNALTMEADRRLMARGIFVQGLRPPTVPPRGSRLRATLMATHTEEDLNRALDAFREVGRELGLI